MTQKNKHGSKAKKGSYAIYRGGNHPRNRKALRRVKGFRNPSNYTVDSMGIIRRVA